MLKTPLCDLFGIEVPIILAPMGTCTSAELAAAVTMTLVPQVVDAVSPMPVVAAGGIFDGRGIAAALMLGAVGVNLGTRFIASTEAPAPDGWKQAITAAESEDDARTCRRDRSGAVEGSGAGGRVAGRTGGVTRHRTGASLPSA